MNAIFTLVAMALVGIVSTAAAVWLLKEASAWTMTALVLHSTTMSTLARGASVGLALGFLASVVSPSVATVAQGFLVVLTAAVVVPFATVLYANWQLMSEDVGVWSAALTSSHARIAQGNFSIR